VHVVNSADENLDILRDIREGREQTIRILDELRRLPEAFDNDILSPKAMEMYFKYYFFMRAHEMDYPIRHQDGTDVNRDDTLLELLSSNMASLQEFARQSKNNYQWILKQSFMSSASAFKAIDAPTRGVIVQYGNEGRRLVGDLAAAREVQKQFTLLRECQKYSVNIFGHQLEQLEKEGAVHEVQPRTGILFVDEEYYSPDFGLRTSVVEAQAAKII
jgi:CRISPR-associated endonuclease/helicase Cas3